MNQPINPYGESAEVPGRQKKWLMIALILALPMMVLMKMAFFLFVIGMLPTICALSVPYDPKRYIFSIVASLNFAGVFPDLFSLAMQGGTPRALIIKLSDPIVWASMYGAGLLGWAIVWMSPSIAMLVLGGVYRGRVLHMQHVQKRLEEEWGQEVTGRRAE
jgi:hypothetical protein